MKLLRRTEPSAPVVEMASGLCPRCDGRGGSDFFPCATCGDRATIEYPREFSKAEDVRLRQLVAEDHPATFIALSMNPARSVSFILRRLQELGIGIEDDNEPPRFIEIRPFDPTKFRGGIE